MKFKATRDANVRLGSYGNFRWKSVSKGEEVELPREVGLNHGFEEVKEMPQQEKGKHGGKTIETKQFKKKLQNIKGVGNKTANDILAVYPSEEDVKEAVAKGEHLPVRNDIEEKIKRYYGQR